MSEPARVLERRVSSYLRALDLEVRHFRSSIHVEPGIIFVQVTTHRLSLRDEPGNQSQSGVWNEKYFNRYVPSPPFRLWCIFMTESDPNGGWWIDDGESRAQSDENSVLDYYLNGMYSWAEHAVTADIIVTSCGVNLGLADSRKQVISYISS